jgi:ABC-type branched-subunit amino acid transport system permease subunit
MIRRMRPAGLLQRRPLLLAAAASTGVITGHVLDALGLLPGVHEPAAVRAAALAPLYTLLTVLGAAVVAVVAEQVLRRRHPWLAVATLVAGQTALLWMPEALAEAATPRTGGGGDAAELTKLAVAVGLQVVLAALTVLVAVVVDTVLLRLPRTLDVVRLPDPRRAAVVVAAVLTGRIVGGVRGRGPPVPVIP